MAGEMNDYIGAAFISGGKLQDQKTACDMWALNVDWAVQYVENPKEIQMENIWTRLDLDDPTIFCRWGHSTGFVNHQYMLVYGGINHQNYMVRDSFVFDMVDFFVLELEEIGDKPVVRLSNSNLLEAGNGMMTLYGGEDYERKGHYTDIWHLAVTIQ